MIYYVCQAGSFERGVPMACSIGSPEADIAPSY